MIDSIIGFSFDHNEPAIGLGPNEFRTKFLKEDEDKPRKAEWIAEYTLKYGVAENYPLRDGSLLPL